jgi:hypothetical protein
MVVYTNNRTSDPTIPTDMAYQHLQQLMVTKVNLRSPRLRRQPHWLRFDTCASSADTLSEMVTSVKSDHCRGPKKAMAE